MPRFIPPSDRHAPLPGLERMFCQGWQSTGGLLRFYCKDFQKPLKAFVRRRGGMLVLSPGALHPQSANQSLAIRHSAGILVPWSNPRRYAASVRRLMPVWSRCCCPRIAMIAWVPFMGPCAMRASHPGNGFDPHYASLPPKRSADRSMTRLTPRAQSKWFTPSRSFTTTSRR